MNGFEDHETKLRAPFFVVSQMVSFAGVAPARSSSPARCNVEVFGPCVLWNAAFGDKCASRFLETCVV